MPARRTSIPDVLYVDDGDLLTSAGVAAGIDLCLHLLRRDHGVDGGERGRPPDRRRAAPRRRSGAVHRARRARRATTAAWRRRARRRSSASSEPLTVAQLAHHACTQRAHVQRAASAPRPAPRRSDGCTQQRVDHARGLLETSDLPVEAVAQRCGFGSAAVLRQHFRRATATTPTAYRRTFAGERTAARRDVASPLR